MRQLGLLYSASAVMAMVCIVVLTMVVTFQVVGRVAGVLVPSVPEIAGFLLGAAIFLALPDTLRRRELIRINIVLNMLGTRTQQVLEVVYRVLGFAVMIYIAYRLFLLTVDSFEFGDRSSGLVGVPLWIPQAAMTFGAALLSVRFAEEAVLYAFPGVANDARPSGSEQV